MTAAISPMHYSVRDSLRIRTPGGMGRMPLSPEQVEVVERQALEVFAKMSNCGAPFAMTLAAIYLSGMDAAISCLKAKG